MCSVCVCVVILFIRFRTRHLICDLLSSLLTFILTDLVGITNGAKGYLVLIFLTPDWVKTHTKAQDPTQVHANSNPALQPYTVLEDICLVTPSYPPRALNNNPNTLPLYFTSSALTMLLNFHIHD